jgi:hypothetical protein
MIVQGNSGSAILDKKMNVVGIATYVSIAAGENEDWVKKGTRFSEARRFGLRLTPELKWQKITWEKYKNLAKMLEDDNEFADCIFKLSLDWFKGPFKTFDKESYPQFDAANWINNHNSALVSYNNALKKGTVRSDKDLQTKNNKVREVMRKDYKALADIFRRRAVAVKNKIQQNEKFLSQFLKDEMTQNAKAMEIIAGQLEKAGEDFSRNDAFKLGQ